MIEEHANDPLEDINIPEIIQPGRLSSVGGG
jgi:hypothetical protein